MNASLAFIGTLLAAIVVHEATHYAACRLVGAPAKPTIYIPDLLPTAAIRTDPLAHTTATYRAACLAPLVVFIPSVAVGVGIGLASGLLIAPYESFAPGMWVMWCTGTCPSPADLRQAYHAGEVDVARAAMRGPHPQHQTAEGIAT